MLSVQCFIHNSSEWKSNSYVVHDNFRNCIIIDPSDYEEIIRFINESELSLKGIFLTHGHFDHIKGLGKIMEEFNSCLFINKNDCNLLNDTFLNCSLFLNEHVVIKCNNKKIIYLSNNEEIFCLNEKMICYSTPGHTLGSMCFLFKESKLLFTGDTLFKGTIGRVDLPSSDENSMKKSIELIKNIDGDYKIYPGHGQFTTLKIEKGNNPYLIERK